MKYYSQILILAILFGYPAHAQWTTPRPIYPAATRAQVCPIIAVSKGGVIAIACREGGSSSDSGQIGVYRSTDNGLSFQRGGVLIPNNFDYMVDPPYATAFDTTGALWVLWGWDWLPGGLPVGSYLELNKSTDNGISFTTVLRHWRGLILKPSRMIIDGQNNLHLLRDSVLASQGPRIVYTKLPNCNVLNRFDGLLPLAPGADNGNNSADMGISNTNVIHYVNEIMRYTGTAYEFKVEYSRSLDGGTTFSPLVVVDSITPPNQLYPRVICHDSIVLIAYYFPDSLNSRKALVSQNNGMSFLPPFSYGNSRPWGLAGKLVSDSLYLYSLHYFSTGTVCSRYSDPTGEPSDTAMFENLSGSDLAIGRHSGKYAFFTQSGVRSALFASKDIPTSVFIWSSTIPNSFSVRAYPNPFNSSAVLSISLPVLSDVKLDIFDVLGRFIVSEVHKNLEHGFHQLHFVASDLSSGMYFSTHSSGLVCFDDQAASRQIAERQFTPESCCSY